MSVYAPALRTAAPQPVSARLAAAPAAGRHPVDAGSTGAGSTGESRADASRADRAARRREIERADRQRAQAERVRDNLAARHPLGLR